LSSGVILEFISRECKSGLHTHCSSHWEGLGYEIVCICNCDHKMKKGEASIKVSRPIYNASTLEHVSSGDEFTDE
jgi:hypothetical protein